MSNNFLLFESAVSTTNLWTAANLNSIFLQYLLAASHSYSQSKQIRMVANTFGFQTESYIYATKVTLIYDSNEIILLNHVSF